jgi:hypothetical protein
MTLEDFANTLEDISAALQRIVEQLATLIALELGRRKS